MNILFTSVGRRSYLLKYFKDSLGERGEIFAANSSEISPAFCIADHTVVTPIIYSDEYIPFLLRYCEENQIKAIISLFDVDLPILAKNKSKFEDIGVTVIVSDLDIINICNDKLSTYKFLLKNKFKTPLTYICVEDAVEAVNQGIIQFPLMIKPRWGMGSISVYEADDKEELKVFYNKVKREIKKTYLKYESDLDTCYSVIIQQKLEGKEYGLDVINDLKGNYQNTICKLKYAMRSGETDCAITVENNTLRKLGKKLANSLHHIGNLDCDVFMVGNDPYVLEMNARFGGGYPFSHMAGVNLPSAIIGWILGEKTDESYLKERINIMSHKDISLVRLRVEPKVNIIPEIDEKNIYQAISMLENELNPSLRKQGIQIEEYAKKLSALGKSWIVLDEEKNICGIISAYLNDKTKRKAYVSFIAIKAQYRGMHLAQKLLKIVENESRTKGIETIELEVWKNNINAINFYKAQGFNILRELNNKSFLMGKQLLKDS